MPTGVEEAVVVYELVVGTIELIKAGIEIYDAVKDKSGVPAKLKKVAEQLPSVEDLLKSAQEQYEKNQANKDNWVNAKADVQQCEKHCKALRDLLDHVLPKEEANVAERTYKATKNVFGGKSKEAEKLLKEIYEVLSRLQHRQIITNTALLEDIKAAVDELLGEDGGKYYHSGSGDQNIVEGSGSLYKQSGSNSKMFTAPVTGLTFNEVTNVNHTWLHGPELSEEQIVDRLLVWLRFGDIHDRRERVSKAHATTFRWMFSDESTKSAPNLSFVEWLQHGQGVYWITGKAGSGKSTLMKYVTDNPRLEEHLGQWSGSQRLLIGSYYFWNAGSHEQKSLEGLYRTLLWEVLRADRQLARLAFPDWRPAHKDTPPKLPALSQAMDNILGKRLLYNKYCFIIDGLDEYEHADSIKKTQLAKDMIALTRSSEVKIIISSRPETPFKTQLGCYPKLEMEKFTGADVAAYVTERVSTSTKLHPLNPKMSKEIADLAEDVVENAKGVFMWVKIAVNILLDGITNRDDIWTLRKRLAELDPELEALYAQILRERISQHYKTEAYRYLVITSHWRSHQASAWRSSNMPIRAPVLAVAQATNNPQTAATLAAETLDVVKDRSSTLPTRLATCCLGLLECCQTGIQSQDNQNLMGANDSFDADGDNVDVFGLAVDFSHRSVFEFLSDNTIRKTLQSGIGSQFDVNTAIMAGLIASSDYTDQAYKSVLPKRVTARRADEEPFVAPIDDIFTFNRLAELSTGSAQTKLLTCLDGRMRGWVALQQQHPHQTSGHRYYSTVQLVTGEMHHWTDALLEDYSRPCEWHTDLLAFTIRTGSALYLRDQAQQRIVTKKGRPLLDYAVFPEPSYSSHVYGMNPRAAKILLQNGASPNDKFNGWSPWQNALYFLCKHQGIEPFTLVARRQSDEERQQDGSRLEVAYGTEILETLEILLDHKADPNACCEVVRRVAKRQYENRRYNGYTVVKSFILGAGCCGDNDLQTCGCDIAKALRPRAEKLLERLKSYQTPAPPARSIERLQEDRDGQHRVPAPAKGISSLLQKLGLHKSRNRFRNDVDTVEDGKHTFLGWRDGGKGRR